MNPPRNTGPVSYHEQHGRLERHGVRSAATLKYRYRWFYVAMLGLQKGSIHKRETAAPPRFEGARFSPLYRSSPPALRHDIMYGFLWNSVNIAEVALSHNPMHIAEAAATVAQTYS